MYVAIIDIIKNDCQINGIGDEHEKSGGRRAGRSKVLREDLQRMLVLNKALEDERNSGKWNLEGTLEKKFKGRNGSRNVSIQWDSLAKTVALQERKGSQNS